MADLSPQQPYFSFSSYLKKRFGEKVWRIPVDAGADCPNRDGKISHQGCVFCDNRSFNPYLDSNMSLTEQIKQGMERIRSRRKINKFLVYFQTYTNTYGPADEWVRKYETALSFKETVGLMIGTRPDCIRKEILEYLQKKVKENKEIWIEYGLQSSHDQTLEIINRGHDYKTFVDAVCMTSAYKVKIGVHVILGLPGEGNEQTSETARRLAGLPVHGIKLHHLHAVKGTELERRYKSGRWRPISTSDYLESAISFLTLTPSDRVIFRLIGECPEHLLAAPVNFWSKNEFLQALRNEMFQRGLTQGCRVE